MTQNYQNIPDEVTISNNINKKKLNNQSQIITNL